MCQESLVRPWQNLTAKRNLALAGPNGWSFFSGALSVETAPEPLQRLFNRQCCKQHCHAFTGQSFRRWNAAASGIAGVSGHARRNDGLCDHQQTVECGGNARHGSVPDVERLPLVTAPVMRSSIGDDRSFRRGHSAWGQLTNKRNLIVTHDRLIPCRSLYSPCAEQRLFQKESPKEVPSAIFPEQIGHFFWQLLKILRSRYRPADITVYMNVTLPV
jgi:hypothetical protein